MTYLSRKHSLFACTAFVISFITLGAVSCAPKVGVGLEDDPEYTRKVKELNAQVSLMHIASAQELYRGTHNAYGTFDQLIAAELLDKRFAGDSPVVEGYQYRLQLTPQSNERQAEYGVNADPHPDGGPGAGLHFFYIDEGRRLHVSQQRPAAPGDPVL